MGLAPGCDACLQPRLLWGAHSASSTVLDSVLARGGGGGWHRLGRVWGVDTAWCCGSQSTIVQAQWTLPGTGAQPSHTQHCWGLVFLVWGEDKETAASDEIVGAGPGPLSCGSQEHQPSRASLSWEPNEEAWARGSRARLPHPGQVPRAPCSVASGSGSCQ